MKQKLFFLICTRTAGVGTACGNKRNLTSEVSSVTCILTYIKEGRKKDYFSALVN
jgi:hypothetical protein